MRTRRAAILLALLLLTGSPIAAQSLPRVIDVPFVRQERNGCGAASVAMVMHYWGTEPPVPAEVYQRLYRPDRRGILLADMRGYLATHGYQAFTLRGEWADIEAQLAKGRPLIVGLKPKPSKDNHFAVVVGIEGDRVWVNDPTRRKAGRMKLTDFRRMWNNADRWMLIAVPQRHPKG